MPIQFFKKIEHTNTADAETEVLEMISTKTEQYHIKAIGIQKETNGGTLKAYYQREAIGELPTGRMTPSGSEEYPIDLVLDSGQSFLLTLQNAVAGTHAVLYGYVRYEIVGR